MRISGEGQKAPNDASPSEADVSAELYRAELESIKQLPHMPKVGDSDESGLQYTAEHLDGIAHRIWEAERAGTFGDLQDPMQVNPSSREGLEGFTRAVVESEDSSREVLIREQGRDVMGSDGLVTEAEIPQDSAQQTQQETEPRNPVEAMRDSEASVEQVVREARQLHGEYLPDGVLSEDESKTYRRLYGDPLNSVAKTTETSDIEVGKEPQELLDRYGKAISYKERGREHRSGQEKSSPGLDSVYLDHAVDRRVVEAAEHVGGEIRPFERTEATEEDGAAKAHPLTVVGRFQTSPRTVYLPQASFIQPVQQILSEYSNKHVKEMCERLFGGPGLPNSALTPRIGRTLPQTFIPLDASQHGMGQMEANAYVSAVWPSTYVAAISVLVETRKRLGSAWLRDLLAKDGGASVLDAGGGGVGILAWRDIVTAEWEALHSSDASPPPTPLGKSTVLTGADNLRHRAASLLENTTFLPRLPDYVHVRDGATLSDDRPAPQRKQFDVIIAPHTLWSLGEEWQRKQHVQNLWSLLNPEGGVLILIEKGVPRGFEVIAGARELLLSRYIATAGSATYESELESSDEDGRVEKGKGMIIAPCTNHAPCPMYPVPGVSRGRKDYCSFQQRFIRPPFLQRLLGAKGRNHDDVDFSYVAVQKGRDLEDSSAIARPVLQGKGATDSAFEGYEHAVGPEATAHVNPLTLPRLVFPPLKRHGHVTIDLCTPAGKIDRWTISKSFSKAAYRDARKASWGDLWALGAKTRVPRNLRLGGENSKAGRSRSERMMDKAKRVLDRMKEDKQEDRELKAEMEKTAAEEVDAMLDDDDVDVDAEEILKEIEQEERQKGAKAPLSTRQLAQKGAKTTSPRQGGATSSPQRRWGPAAPHDQSINATTKKSQEESTPSQQANTGSRPSSPSNSGPFSTTAMTASPSDHLSPQDLATLQDFAAESRADRLTSLSLARLSRRSASAKLNKFAKPEKEKWQVKLEKKMAMKRKAKVARGVRK